MAGRGALTQAIKNKSLALLGYEITQRELRLMPYVQSVMMNSKQAIDPSKVNPEERQILSQWREKGYIEGGASGMGISKDFWNAISEFLWLAYVNHNEEEDVSPLPTPSFTIFDIEPVLEGYDTPEKNLTAVIELYYKPHFPEDFAQYVERYKTVLSSMVANNPHAFLFAEQPQVGSMESGSDPCLRDLVTRMYRDHFSAEESTAFALDYEQALMRQWTEKTSGKA